MSIKTQQKVLPPTYSQDEAFAASVKYFKGDDLAARVWINKYALKDSEGNLYELTPNDMHNRIAKEIARVDRVIQILYQNKRFLT